MDKQVESDKGVGLLESGYFDSELYESTNTNSKYEGYVTSIAPNEEEDDEEDEGIPLQGKRSVNPPAALLNDVAQVRRCLMSFETLLISVLFLDGQRIRSVRWTPTIDRR